MPEMVVWRATSSSRGGHYYWTRIAGVVYGLVWSATCVIGKMESEIIQVFVQLVQKKHKHIVQISVTADTGFSEKGRKHS